MPPSISEIQTEFIKPLNMNGMNGRMLRMPPTKKKRREILVVYGHHSSLERVYNIGEYLRAYGYVTVPDLPGFGGMDSFYSIGKKPTVDNLADYLASFIKLRYKNRRVSIVGISFGSVIVTRALQKYPELAKKVDILISIAGFVHRKDFRWKRRSFYSLKLSAKLLSLRPLSAFTQHVVLRGPVIRKTYHAVEDKNEKLRDASEAQRQERINFEVTLWQSNDFRTYAYTGGEMFRLDLCNMRVSAPIFHVAVDGDRYFDHNMVEQHMRTIFSGFELLTPKGRFHGPTVAPSLEEVANFIPPKLRKLLNQSS